MQNPGKNAQLLHGFSLVLWLCAPFVHACRSYWSLSRGLRWQKSQFRRLRQPDRGTTDHRVQRPGYKHKLDLRVLQQSTCTRWQLHQLAASPIDVQKQRTAAAVEPGPQMLPRFLQSLMMASRGLSRASSNDRGSASEEGVRCAWRPLAVISLMLGWFSPLWAKSLTNLSNCTQIQCIDLHCNYICCSAAPATLARFVVSQSSGWVSQWLSSKRQRVVVQQMFLSMICFLSCSFAKENIVFAATKWVFSPRSHIDHTWRHENLDSM